MSLPRCAECDHLADNHSHNDTAIPGGGCSTECSGNKYDKYDKSKGPFENCVFRCNMFGCMCPNYKEQKASH